MKCYRCGRSVSEEMVAKGEKICPQCGAELVYWDEKKKENSRQSALGVTGLAAGFLFPALGMTLCLADVFSSRMDRRHGCGKVGLMISAILLTVESFFLLYLLGMGFI